MTEFKVTIRQGAALGMLWVIAVDSAAAAQMATAYLVKNNMQDAKIVSVSKG